MTDYTIGRLQAVARAYAAEKHTPMSGDVRKAYQAFTAEIWAQYLVLEHFGSFGLLPSIGFSDADPYSSSTAMLRACDAGAVHIYSTADDLPGDHPLAMLAPNGQTFNSIFRAVHDVLAHWPERNNFGPGGELAAFQAHARTLLPLAVHALATETLAQNAYFNFGPFAHLSAKLRPYPAQKACLIPCHLILEFLT